MGIEHYAYNYVQPIIGCFVFIGAAYSFYFFTNRKNTPLALKPIFLSALVLLFFSIFLELEFVNDVIDNLSKTAADFGESANRGVIFVFGEGLSGSTEVIFAITVLGAIISFAALMELLYSFDVLPRISRGIANLTTRLFGDDEKNLSSSEIISALTNVFAGLSEAPLSIKDAIPTMSRSQLMTVMTCGFATISAPLAIIYSNLISEGDSALQTVYLAIFFKAIILSVPAAVLIAKIMQPPDVNWPPSRAGISKSREASFNSDSPDSNNNSGFIAKFFEAIITGAMKGGELAVRIGAVLIAILAIIGMLDFILAAVGQRFGLGNEQSPLSIEAILSFPSTAVAWLVGTTTHLTGVASLISTELVATEGSAFSNLGDELQNNRYDISYRDTVIAIYALSGFASIPSIGVQIGALTAIAKHRHREITEMAPRAMLAGLLASYLTASIAAISLAKPIIYDENNPLMVGIAEEPPFVVKQGENDYGGEAILTLKALLEESQFRYDFEVMQFSSLITRLERGDIDVIASQIFITRPRCNLIRFSNPVAHITRSLITSNSQYTTYEAVLGSGTEVLGVLRGGVSQREVEAEFGSQASRRIVFFETYDDAFDALASDDIQAFAGTTAVLSSMLQARGMKGEFTLTPLGNENAAYFTAFAFRQSDSKLAQEFNRLLSDPDFSIDYQRILQSTNLRDKESGVRYAKDATDSNTFSQCVR